MARPRIIPLRDNGGYGVDDLAPFTLLAYMCWPHREDAHKRSRFLQYLRAETSTGRQTRGGLMRHFQKDNHSCIGEGLRAGNFVLTACQLNEQGLSPTYANIARVISYYRKCEGIDPNPQGAERKAYLKEPRLVSGHDTLVNDFTKFRLVSHIWGAFVWRAQEIQDLRNSSVQQAYGTADATANLMGRAAAIAACASSVQRRGRDRGPLLDLAKLWWSDLPPPTFPWVYIPDPLDPDLRKAL